MSIAKRDIIEFDASEIHGSLNISGFMHNLFEGIFYPVTSDPSISNLAPKSGTGFN